MKNIEIVMVDIKKLKAAEYNPRQLSEKQYNDLKESMEKFGFADPLIVNSRTGRKNIIVGGHQRVRLAADLGYEKVPVVYLSLTVEEERELNIRLNKNTGDWDWDMLANNFSMEELNDWGFSDQDLKGFDDEPPIPSGLVNMSFFLTDEQAIVVRDTLETVKQLEVDGGENNSPNGNALWWICSQYAHR